MHAQNIWSALINEGKTNMHFSSSRFGGSAGNDARWRIEFLLKRLLTLKMPNDSLWQMMQRIEILCFFAAQRNSIKKNFLIDSLLLTTPFLLLLTRQKSTDMDLAELFAKVMTTRHAFLQFQPSLIKFNVSHSTNPDGISPKGAGKGCK